MNRKGGQRAAGTSLEAVALEKVLRWAELAALGALHGVPAGLQPR